MSEMAMAEGVLAGGWSFVIAGYAMTAAVLVAYAWALRRRGAGSDETEQDS